jgi:hypothetical protein
MLGIIHRLFLIWSQTLLVTNSFEPHLAYLPDLLGYFAPRPASDAA